MLFVLWRGLTCSGASQAEHGVGSVQDGQPEVPVDHDREEGIAHKVTDHRQQQQRAPPDDVRISAQHKTGQGSHRKGQDLQTTQKICALVLHLQMSHVFNEQRLEIEEGGQNGAHGDND